MYTLEGYERAKAKVRRLEEVFDRYTGNNPDKYQSDLKSARAMVGVIESVLKSQGILSKTDGERLNDELNEAFPDAKSKQVVKYKGKQYQRLYFPLEKSRSREIVTEWGKKWIALE